MKKFNDENLYVPFKSLSIAWTFTTITLFLWSGYQYIISGDYIFPLGILLLMNIVLFISYKILKSKYIDKK